MADNFTHACGDECRGEMLNGEIVQMSESPSTDHNRVAFRLARILADRLEGKTDEAFAYGMDIYLTGKDRVMPDVTIVRDPDIVKKKGIFGAPDFIAEVLSIGSAKNDRGYKMDLYERCGVQEYWIVDLDSCAIEAYILADGRYQLDEVYQFPPAYLEPDDEERKIYETEARLSLYDGLTIPIETIFQDIR